MAAGRSKRGAVIVIAFAALPILANDVCSLEISNECRVAVSELMVAATGSS